jgi:hypothetical protein
MKKNRLLLSPNNIAVIYTVKCCSYIKTTMRSCWKNITIYWQSFSCEYLFFKHLHLIHRLCLSHIDGRFTIYFCHSCWQARYLNCSLRQGIVLRVLKQDHSVHHQNQPRNSCPMSYLHLHCQHQLWITDFLPWINI